MWCGGARETRESHVALGRTVGKSETTKNFPAFQDLNGSPLGIARFGPRIIHKNTLEREFTYKLVPYISI